MNWLQVVDINQQDLQELRPLFSTTYVCTHLWHELRRMNSVYLSLSASFHSLKSGSVTARLILNRCTQSILTSCLRSVAQSMAMGVTCAPNTQLHVNIGRRLPNLLTLFIPQDHVFFVVLPSAEWACKHNLEFLYLWEHFHLCSIL